MNIYSNTMKKIVYLLAIILGMNAAATPVASGQSQNPIHVIISQQGHSGGTPRMPGSYPITAFVYDDTIYLSFSENVGIITVDLEELSEGLLLSTVVDTSEGYAAIPFSGEPGSYRLFFYLSDGTEYIGSFCI